MGELVRSGGTSHGAEIFAQCLWADSFERLEVLLELTLRPVVRLEVAMAAFARFWNVCDAVGKLHFPTWILLSEAKKAGIDFRRFIDPECRAWFDGLPDRITIYRGCSDGDEDGLSWTTSREIAEFFAGPHRSLVPNPVIACTVVNKADVLFATNSREEFEVLVDSSDLDDIDVEPVARMAG